MTEYKTTIMPDREISFNIAKKWKMTADLTRNEIEFLKAQNRKLRLLIWKISIGFLLLIVFYSWFIFKGVMS
jgi:hypothetical protein